MTCFISRTAALISLLFVLAASPAVAQSEAEKSPAQIWDETAIRAETTIEAAAASNLALEALRDELSRQRVEAQAAQEAGIARATSLAVRLTGLGPAPDDPSAESTEITEMRATLTEQLALANAPVFEADLAYRRADELIREIDSLIRTRINQELVVLGPTPLNPAIWGSALNELNRYAKQVTGEIKSAWANPIQQRQLVQRMPFISLLALVGLALLIAVRPIVNTRISARIDKAKSPRRKFSWSLLLSASRVIIPSLGALALIRAITLTDLAGFFAETLVSGLPMLAMILVVTYWLAHGLNGSRWAFSGASFFPESHAKSGRMVVTAMGTVMALHILLDLVAGKAILSADHTAVLNFPLILLGSLALYRTSGLINLAVTERNTHAVSEKGDGFNLTFLPLMRRATQFVAIAAPVLAAIGYFAAARFLLYPTILTLGLLGGTYIVFGILVETANNWLGSSDEEGEAGNLRLLPVVFGFVLALAVLPVLALIWGARRSDLTETWIWLNNGVPLGEAHISLTDVVSFALVFAIGYTLTRLLQKLLRNSVLPRTRMDAGGRNAILSGISYVGFTIAGLVAVSATGIDLSSLAIVAGALSVGVGFGLQTIVSNFVSGIILLVERPIKEGDWIEVGQYSGYVRRIAVRSTEIENFDRGMVIIPNSDLIAGTVLNWTHSNLVGRVKVPIGVAYGSDARQVERILLEVAESHPMVLRNPAPSVVFHGFGADSMDFEVRAFLRDVNWQLSAKSDINFDIVKRFAEAGIEIPFAQRDINLKNIDQIAKAFKGEDAK